MKIAITGAGGSQQSAIARGLAAAGHEVVALARDAHPELPGVSWVKGHASDREALTQLLSGADALAFHLPVSDPAWPVDTVLDVASDQGVKRLVFNASARVPGPEEPQQPSNGVVASMRRRGFDFVVLQPTLYLENLLLPIVLDDLREGVLRYPLPASDFSVAWVATDDLGPLAANALEHQTTGLIAAPGAAAVTGTELAAAIGEGLQREIRFEPLTPQAFGDRLATLLGEGPARGVQGLYEGIAAMPAAFTPWLQPDDASTELARAVGPTSVADWARSTLKPALG
jgi:uncharacterized protein YbjT (DUF2867 family)